MKYPKRIKKQCSPSRDIKNRSRKPTMAKASYENTHGKLLEERSFFANIG